MHLYPHQKRVVDFMETHHGVLCLHSTGTGKSITSVATANRLVELHLVSHVVALVKKSIIEQFTKEVANVNPDLVPKFRITTAETFLRVGEFPTPDHTFFIIDEAHAFSNPDGVITQRLHAYAVQCRRVMLLTATPYSNTLYDIAPLLGMIKSEPIVTKKEFDAILGKGVTSASFKAWVKDCVSVHTIDKSNTAGYPKLTEHVVSITMKPQTSDSIKHLMEVHEKPFFAAERQLSFGVGTCEKCKWLTRHMKEWFARGEDRVVIYVAFIEKGVTPLLELLKSNGVNAVLIDGETPLGVRQKVLKVFNRIDDPQTGGTRRANICGDDEWYTRVTTRRNPNEFKYYRHFNMDTLKPSKPIRPTEDELSVRPPIPPAWSPAVVCTRKNPKIRWGALDSKKRWQRRYSQEWESGKEEKKMHLIKHMDHAFWKKFDHVIYAGMKKGWGQEKLHALAAKTMSLCHFRVGGTDDDTHFGTTTLRKEHCTLDNGHLTFSFVGKSGVKNTCTVPPQPYVTEMAKLLDGKGNLFAHDGVTISDSSFRAYLKTNNINMRPKDFRTFHANLRMLQELMKTDPTTVAANKRKDVVNDAFKAVAEDLNNTPTVTKSSYVFNAMWVYYLTSPAEFKASVAGNGPITSKLTKFISKFFDHLDWRKMLSEYKDTFGLKTFINKDITTLVITDAGAESLDLKGVRHVVLMDSVWNKAAEEQIIGRGQRFKSHAHLPPSQQTIASWKLILDFPSGKSPERLIYEHVETKYKETKQLYAVLKSVSI